MVTFYFIQATLLLLGILLPTGAQSQSVGVCYGRNGDNLPSDQDVINLYNANGIGRMRLYDPVPAALQALRGTDIELILGVPNTQLKSLTNPAAAKTWVQNNILNYFPGVKFRYISVGNQVAPNNGDTSKYVNFVLPAMRNVHDAIVAAGLQNQIKVSTATYSGITADSYPPSRAKFRDDCRSFIEPIIRFLAENNSPLLANIYPYFTLPGDLQYALFTAPGVVVWDGNLQYSNMFDALLDVIYFAAEKVGVPNIEVVVSESGWPSAGGAYASVENAQTYYQNLINHVESGKGTPKKPGKSIETYLFGIFDENRKGGAETEKHFGVFNPTTQQQKYQLDLFSKGAQSVGVCYGINGDNLPSEQDVINLYKANGIGRMRLYENVPAALQALRGTNIQLILDVQNRDLEYLTNSAAAKTWVQNNILNYPSVNFRYISVGNEVAPNNNGQYLNFVLPAMRNVHDAIVAAGLQNRIKVSTTTYSGITDNTYPPSQSKFRDDSKSFIRPIIQFLAENKSPLLANIYPYFTLPGNLQYALFTAPEGFVTDPVGNLQYSNMFDALLDVIYSAAEKAGGPNIEVVVAETGWPSAGGSDASVGNAQTYYKNLIDHVKSGKGTPKRPGKNIETYLFAMFDENKKGGAETEKHFGVFNPTTQQQKFQLNFS